jgi:shikimate dehydrogenase
VIKRRRLAVLGSPIAHSLSPALHRTAYGVLGLDWQYDAIDVTAEQLPDFLAGLGPEWVGLSLTMPLKAAVLPLLEHLGRLVEVTGAANTGRFAPDGATGENTDVPGLRRLVAKVGDGSARVVLLGGGATARSTLTALAEAGTSRAVVVSRSPTVEVVEFAAGLGMAIEVRSWDDVRESADAADLLISTVPGPATTELAKGLQPNGSLLDVAYDPWPTPLADLFHRTGHPVATGFDLLVEQAALQVEFFTGLGAPIEQMREVGWRVLSARS